MAKRRPAEPATPPERASTERQRLVALLEREELSFEDLRRELLLPRRAVEEHLRHVERSARGSGRRLRVVPAACRDCGHVFHGREARHLHAPGRCPRCRGERIEEPRFRIE